MDLIQLRYFLKVAELRSFTKAAEALHIAQPAVTRQIRLLEAELGVQLLLRHSKGAMPTEAGLRLMAGAESMLRLAHETRADVVASAPSVAGNLRVGFPPALGAAVVAKTVMRFHRLYPNVRLQLEEGDSHRVRDAMLADRLDLGVLTNSAAHPQLVLQPLFDERLWVLHGVAMQDAFGCGEVSLAQLAAWPLAQFSAGDRVCILLASQAKRMGLALRIALESESVSIIKAIVTSGLAVHVAPFTAFRHDLLQGTLAGRPMEGLHIMRQLAARAGRPRTPAQSCFLGILLEEITSLVDSSQGMLKPVHDPAQALRAGPFASADAHAAVDLQYRTRHEAAGHHEHEGLRDVVDAADAADQRSCGGLLEEGFAFR